MAKFRFHWGWAIGVFYSLFVIAMLTIVIKSFTVDNSLVVDDYYSYDIAYQDHADKVTNTRALQNDVSFDFDEEAKSLKISFPDIFKTYTGTIQFYKPDNKKLDFEKEVMVDEMTMQVIDLQNIVSGFWKIKINWEGNAVKFYKEHQIYLK